MVEFAAFVFLLITCPIWLPILLGLGFAALVLGIVVALFIWGAQNEDVAGVLVLTGLLIALFWEKLKG